MKKVFGIMIMLVTLLLFHGCQKNADPEQVEPVKKDNNETVVEINEGFTEIYGYQVYVRRIKEYPVKFDECVGAYAGDVVPDEEAALRITKQIFDSIDKPSAYDGFEPTMLTYDESNMTWIVTFNKPGAISEDTIMIGNCFSIAIQQKDGKVLRMWAGE